MRPGSAQSVAPMNYAADCCSSPKTAVSGSRLCRHNVESESPHHRAYLGEHEASTCAEPKLKVLADQL